MQWLEDHEGRGLIAVAIAPDLGERYLDTVYQTNWVQHLYGAEVISADDAVRPRSSEQPGDADGELAHGVLSTGPTPVNPR
jgi:cysteine synthase A